MPTRPLAYFDYLIEAFENGRTGRSAHLGHWGLLPDGRPDVNPSEPFSAAQSRLDDVMIELAKLQSGHTILDIGCGLGGLIERIDAQFREVHLTGINIDPQQLDICQRIRSRSQNIIRWSEADACDLPFESETFDRVFSVEAMFHFASRRRFLEQARRVLKPGGRLVLTDILLVDSVQTQSTPRFMIEALLNDGYGPWPDPWGESGNAFSIGENLGFANMQLIDATTSTAPTYDFIIPQQYSECRDPGSINSRAAMLLRWLHHNGGLRYEYLVANKP